MRRNIGRARRTDVESERLGRSERLDSFDVLSGKGDLNEVRLDSGGSDGFRNNYRATSIPQIRWRYDSTNQSVLR